MTIQEIKLLKEELEWELYELLRDFQDKTDTIIDKVELNKYLVATDEPEVLCDVRLEIKI